MGVLSGSSGAVNGVESCGSWQISSSADLQKRVASNTKGGPVRLAGNKDWSGQYMAYGWTAVHKPGDLITFTGDMGNGKGATGAAIVDKVEIKIDIEGGKEVQYTVSFSANGALTMGAASATDASSVVPLSSIGATASFNSVEIPDIRTITLVFQRENPAYVSSSTGAQRKRVVGNFDASAAIAVYTDDTGAIPAVNALAALTVTLTGPKVWTMEWMVVREASNVQVDIEGAKPVEATLNFEFSGFKADGTEGSVEDPDGNEWWPNATS